jgi:hypothetical protein
MDKVVKNKTECEECGKEFEGEFIQHDKPTDDWQWEKEPQVHGITDEDGTVCCEVEPPEDKPTYPHLHEQPKPECHFCPDCIAKFKQGGKQHG